VRGLEDRVSIHGYSLVVCNTDEQPEREALDLELLIDRRVDGLVIAPTGRNQPLFENLVRQGAPLVFLDRKPAQAFGPFVGIDNAAAGYSAAEYLLKRGHRRIAVLARNPTLSTVSGRAAGYRHALADYGVAADDELVEITRGTVEDASDGADRLLRRADRPTAIITGNHIMTLGLLNALAARNLRCYEDVSMVCFDDNPWAAMHTPPLTVMAQPLSQICDAVAGAMLSALWNRGSARAGAGQPFPLEGDGDVLLSARLIERASVRILDDRHK
jgi:LacI family transcriptional regulator